MFTICRIHYLGYEKVHLMFFYQWNFSTIIFIFIIFIKKFAFFRIPLINCYTIWSSFLNIKIMKLPSMMSINEVIFQLTDLEFQKKLGKTFPGDPKLALTLVCLNLRQEWMLSPNWTRSRALAFPGRLAIRVPQLNQLSVSHFHHIHQSIRVMGNNSFCFYTFIVQLASHTQQILLF